MSKYLKRYVETKGALVRRDVLAIRLVGKIAKDRETNMAREDDQWAKELAAAKAMWHGVPDHPEQGRLIEPKTRL